LKLTFYLMKRGDFMATSALEAGPAGSVTATLDERREDFYARAGTNRLAPLWRVLKGLVAKEPLSVAVPAMWRYAEVRPFLLEACNLIGTKEAERRVLMLENPGVPSGSKITGSLYAGLQIIQPQERASSHRHVAAALRFVVEGTGGWTAVGGERTAMRPGDFVVTPSWEWHEHGNDGAGPVVWLDCLDVHIVNLLDCGFREEPAAGWVSPQRPAGASVHEYGANLLPMDADRSRVTSPIFNYPYARTREALDSIARFREADPHAGYKLRYVNPLNADWAIATIATWMQLLPKGFQTAPYRSTDGTVLVIVEGTGYTEVNGVRFDWSPGDIIAVPGWTTATHHARSETVIFGASDRATQEKLGLWREQPNPAVR
jgi:gentisate 1,2-dioxygenase